MSSNSTNSASKKPRKSTKKPTIITVQAHYLGGKKMGDAFEQVLTLVAHSKAPAHSDETEKLNS